MTDTLESDHNPEKRPFWEDMTADELLQHGAATQNPFLVHMGRGQKDIVEGAEIMLKKAAGSEEMKEE